MIFGKIWGTTTELFNHSGVECHRLFVKAGYSCSIHRHAKRNNAFYVESGSLVIEVHKNDYELVDYTVLQSGDRTEVSGGEEHRFIALKDTVALEWYWENKNPEDKDIERSTVGHKMDSLELKKIMDRIKS